MAVAHGRKFTKLMCERSFLRILCGSSSFLTTVSAFKYHNHMLLGPLKLQSANFASRSSAKENIEEHLHSTAKELSNAKQNINPLHHLDYFDVHRLVNMNEMFNARVHLGHHEGCWNPLMKPYILGTREHYHIIDLNETARHLKVALNVLCHVVSRNGRVLFVSTHPQFEQLVQQTARDSGEFFVTSRWRGGTFTNSYMMIGTKRLPDLVIFLNLLSLGRNQLAVKEAAQCNIPCIGIIDTDCNPNLIMYPVPGNDDSQQAVELYCKIFKEAILKAKKKSESKFKRGHKEQTEELEEEFEKKIQPNSRNQNERSDFY